MALSTPVLEEIKPFDANDIYDFQFTYNKGGMQYSKSNLIISTSRGDGTDQDVYDVNIDSYDPFHTYVPGLALATLENGKQYRAKIRVGTGDSWSEFSEWRLFYAHSTPVVVFTNISTEGQIYNHIDSFQVSYTMPVGEHDPLVSYHFELYDKNMRLINKYPKRYPSGVMVEQIVKDLEVDKEYNIRFKAESSHGRIVDIVREFTPTYEPPILGETTFLVNNLESKPSVKIEYELYQIDGTVMNGEYISFEDDTWVDLKNKSIYYNTDFHIEDDFVLKLWFKDLDNNKTILKMVGDNGSSVKIIYSYNRIHVCKYRGNSPHSTHVVCRKTISPDQSTFMIVKQIDNMIDITCQQL